MVKLDLAEKISQKLGCGKKEAMEMLEGFLEIMKKNLEAGNQLKISGFGVFSVRDKRPRRGRNPQTGEGLTIDSRKVVTFKASVLLKSNINKSC